MKVVGREQVAAHRWHLHQLGYPMKSIVEIDQQGVGLKDKYLERTIFKVINAYSLTSPWKYPNMTERGRNMISLGFRIKRPMSLTTLVKANMKTN